MRMFKRAFLVALLTAAFAGAGVFAQPAAPKSLAMGRPARAPSTLAPIDWFSSQLKEMRKGRRNAITAKSPALGRPA